MTFAAPLWLAAAAVVAAGVVVAHLFSTSVPPRNYLPTVRFVPEDAPLAVLRTRRVTDVLLLLLRLLVVALLGLALAGAHVPRRGPPRVVLIDRSRATGSMTEARDSARAIASGATLIAFDSVARVVPDDSLGSMALTGMRGSLSGALVAAHRAMVHVTSNRGATELVLVSPVVREEIDSATTRLLALWEGPIRAVRVAAAVSSAVSAVDVRAPLDDPVRAALGSRPSALGDNRSEPRAVRLVRDRPTRADSAWARDSAGALVVWPPSNFSSVLPRRQTADTSGGFAAGQHVVIGSFVRGAQPGKGNVLVRWIDGEPAATEMALGRGCVRDVAIPVDPIGDLPLRNSFRGVVAVLVESCGGARDFAQAQIPRLTRNDAVERAARVDAGVARDDRLGTWLAVIALALLLGEQFLRVRPRATA